MDGWTGGLVPQISFAVLMRGDSFCMVRLYHGQCLERFVVSNVVAHSWSRSSSGQATNVVAHSWSRSFPLPQSASSPMAALYTGTRYWHTELADPMYLCDPVICQLDAAA
eukprot:1162059-Pelagomonas_calceolata.AAC.5